MKKKIAVTVLGAALIVLAGGYLWARAVFTGDAVRSALAAQLAKAIGQPVTIGQIDARAFPRVEIQLGDVAIGSPVRIRLADLRVATDVRALLSRRIEHGSVRLNGARIELPLPPINVPERPNEPSGAPASRSSPVQVVSIDEIVLRDVEIVSGGRTLHGDVELEPRDREILLRRASLAADGTRMTATGRIVDLSGPSGEINVKASALNVDQLARFASAFSGGTAPERPAPASRRRTGSEALSLVVSLDADRATFRGLVLDKFSGRARVAAQAVALDPIRFQVFGGRYDGAATFTPAADALVFHARASVADVDVAAATRFAGNPDTISGRLSGRLDCSGRASDAGDVASTIRGTARVDLVDGMVKNLGLLRSIVVATSMREGAGGGLTGWSKDEKFSRLGATLRIANGDLTSDDIRFESENLRLDARGALQMMASTVDLRGKVQLSDALSRQAGSELLRYTQENGRVTLPATVAGLFAAPHVSIDTADLTTRALSNVAAGEVEKRLKNDSVKKGILGLLKR